MANKYRHKKTGLEVIWGSGSQRYFAVSSTNSYYLPKEVVEDSAEWEELVPLTDFYGKEVDTSKVYYKVWLMVDDTTSVCNALSDPKGGSKVITIFTDYRGACEFQRLYIILKKAKTLVATDGNNPSSYLKNLLKTL